MVKTFGTFLTSELMKADRMVSLCEEELRQELTTLDHRFTKALLHKSREGFTS